ncbi:MAG: site-specific DNA-methyltransferase [Bacteroidales bacterium]|nr:site-specific DNA-methyltransferase [Bacteroidales bacterium]
MAKRYTGSLTLEWYNKQKSIMLKDHSESGFISDTPAPKINWVNKEEALFYEIDNFEGKGLTPYWVDRNDIRIKEARPLKLVKSYTTVRKGEGWKLEKTDIDNPQIENILIKGDNLLSINSLKKLFNNKPEEEKVKCVYLDPPYNTGRAFENYDDNLEVSQWLTLIRDRISVIKDLMRNDGFLFVQIDDLRIAHLRILLDDIFGSENFVNCIVVKMSETSGVKMSHVTKRLPKLKEYILVYKKTENAVFNPIRISKSLDDDKMEKYLKYYNKVIINPEAEVEDWIIKDIKLYLTENNLPTDEESINNFKIENAERVVYRTNNATFSNLNIDKELTKVISSTGIEYIWWEGKQMLFLSDYIEEYLCDLWLDISTINLNKEGGIDLPQSKKPEKLIARIIDLATNPGDYVFDCFGGSGTTYAVAHKLGRKWIGVEMGNHADTHIIKRLTKVLEGDDFGGITSEIDWSGGGSFKYFHLGESILSINSDGSGDFNWKLGNRFIQESFLQSYDYDIVSIDLPIFAELINDTNEKPSIGIQKVGNKTRIAIVSLNPPEGNNKIIGQSELKYLYDTLKKRFSPEFVNIFTNRGVDIPLDSKPEDLEVFKIPQAIFAELEK